MRCDAQVVMEGDNVDTDVTTPAATYALALIFLKTGNRDIAKLFAVPKTEYQLDQIRYDFILHLVLAKGLVLWDDILPTEQWIRSMLPPLMTNNDIDAYFHPDASQKLHEIGQAHLHGIAGACLAMGLRFASSHNEAARELVTGYITKLLEHKSNAVDGLAFPRDSFGKIDKQMIESLISVFVVALGLIMAGSGHLNSYLIMENLHKRVTKRSSLKEVQTDMGYGNYMAISMAIGFLFLGGGQQGDYCS